MMRWKVGLVLWVSACDAPRSGIATQPPLRQPVATSTAVVPLHASALPAPTTTTSAFASASATASATAAPVARPPLEGVVERTVPGVISPALEAIAMRYGEPLASCLDAAEHMLQVDVVMRSDGAEVTAKVWRRKGTRSGGSLGARGNERSEDCALQRLAEVAWPLREKERTRLSFSATPHNAAADQKGWAFFSVGGGLDGKEGLGVWEGAREDLIACGASSLVAIYTASGAIRGFTSASGRRACIEKILRKLELGSNSAGGEFCVSFGRKPLRACPMPTILGSKDEVPGFVSLE